MNPITEIPIRWPTITERKHCNFYVGCHPRSHTSPHDNRHFFTRPSVFHTSGSPVPGPMSCYACMQIAHARTREKNAKRARDRTSRARQPDEDKWIKNDNLPSVYRSSSCKRFNELARGRLEMSEPNRWVRMEKLMSTGGTVADPIQWTIHDHLSPTNFSAIFSTHFLELPQWYLKQYF